MKQWCVHSAKRGTTRLERVERKGTPDESQWWSYECRKCGCIFEREVCPNLNIDLLSLPAKKK